MNRTPWTFRMLGIVTLLGMMLAAPGVSSAQGGSRTFPVGGGSLQDVGMATPRAINFGPVGKEMVGRGGQTSTQVVVLSNPPKSWSVIPLGESDHQASGHWDDQAEKLFSKGKMKSTYFMDRKELERHVSSQKVLEFGK